MHPGSHPFWAHVVSPYLRALAPGVTTSISPVFIEHVPLADAGDFPWALMCISQWTPHEMLQAYRIDAALPRAPISDALLESACESKDFYGFPAGELTRLLRRLEANIERSPAGSEEKGAHQAALSRIQHLVTYIAAAHPAADMWVRNTPKLRSVPKRKSARPSHLSLVVSDGKKVG